MKAKTIGVGLMAALCLGVIGVVAVLGIQGAYSANLTSERSKLTATAQVTAAFVAREMAGVVALEQLTVKAPGFVAALGTGAAGHYQLGVIQVALDQLATLEPDFQFASIADADGTLWAISPKDPSLVGENFAYRDWYVGIMRTGKTYVSNAYVSAVAGAPLLVGVAAPIYAANPTGQRGALLGILLVGYKIGSVQAFTSHLSSMQQIGLQLADQQGTLMTTQAVAGGSVVATEGPALLAALNGRSVTSISSDTLSAGAPVVGIGWALSVSTPLSATPAGAGSAEVTVVAIGLLVALGLGGCAVVVVTGRLERAYSRREAAENKLRAVQESLTDGIIVYDAAGGLASMNPATQHLFDLEPGDETGASFASRCDLIDEDGAMVPIEQSPVIALHDTAAPYGAPTLGIRGRTSQTVRWLSISTSPIHGAHARIDGYVSSVRDITERLEMIRALRIVSAATAEMGATLDRARVIAALTEAASELCSAIGEPRRRAQLFLVDGLKMVNAGAHDPEQISGIDGISYEIADHPYVQQVIATHEATMAHLDYSAFGPSVAPAMRLAGVTNCVWVPMIGDGEVFAILAVAGRQNGLVRPSTVEHLKAVAGMAVLARAKVALHDALGNLARTDPLTGTANRRALNERISQLPRMPFAFVAIDVDGLKPVNDTHGHAAGDELLAAVAARMQAELRSADVLARTGGDEFVVLMVGPDETGASELAARLKESVSRLELPWGSPSISVGSAAGAAGAEPTVVAAKADEALYAAKQLLHRSTALSIPITSGSR